MIRKYVEILLELIENAQHAVGTDLAFGQVVTRSIFTFKNIVQ